MYFEETYATFNAFLSGYDITNIPFPGVYHLYDKTNQRQSEDGFTIVKSAAQMTKKIVQPRLNNLFRQLSDRIDEHDADALTLVAEIKTLLDPSFPRENFQKLESLLNGFKFAQAQKALGKVAKELGI